MKPLSSIAVFCGSSSGNDPILLKTAFELGCELARADITLVYGGAKVGLMGAVANGALSLGGRVVGVIPGFLNHNEIAHENLSELITVGSLHERKVIMHERSMGVIALPGGFGTMEEFMELLTWAQLGLHQKPLALLNVTGYYDLLLSFFDTMVESGLLKQENRAMVLVSDTVKDVLVKLSAYQPLPVRKWV